MVFLMTVSHPSDSLGLFLYKNSNKLISLLFIFFLKGGPDDNLIEGGGTKFVCKPGARNITVIFHPLLR